MLSIKILAYRYLTVGGFIADYTTWRWDFWSITIANVFVQLLAFICLRETYPPRILGKEAARIRRKTGNKDLHTEWDDPERTLTKLYIRSFSRPWKLLFTQPIIQVLACYNAYNYGILYLFISTFPTLWEEKYGESVGIGGLNFISIAAGNLIASQICAPCNDAIYKILKRRYNYTTDQEGIPEFRLPLMVIGALVTPIGLFWYGWSAQAGIFWLMPNIGVALYAAGSLICYQCIQVYIVDSYTSYAASAMAATTFLRSLCSFSFPLFAPYLVKALGYGWEGTLLGCIAIVLGIPTPFVLWRWGAKIREKSPFCAGNMVHN
jgi:MFS family permease